MICSFFKGEGGVENRGNWHWEKNLPVSNLQSLASQNKVFYICCSVYGSFEVGGRRSWKRNSKRCNCFANRAWYSTGGNVIFLDKFDIFPVFQARGTFFNFVLLETMSILLELKKDYSNANCLLILSCRIVVSCFHKEIFDDQKTRIWSICSRLLYKSTVPVFGTYTEISPNLFRHGTETNNIIINFDQNH